MAHSRTRFAVAVLSALALAVPALGQPNFDEVEIETIEVTRGIYMLVGFGGNLGLAAGPEGAFLIDDQFAPLADKIKEAVRKVSPAPLRFILNTHWHGDHSGGNEPLDKTSIWLVAHDNVRQRMSTEQFNDMLGRTTPPSPAAALPEVTFTDAVTFHLNGEEIRAYHPPPAHTDGDSIVIFTQANVVHMGDVFFNGIYPFVDLWSGGSVDGMIEAVKGALEHIDADTKIIPGHGPLAGRADLEAYLAMLEATRAAVAAQVAAGKSLEETVAAKPTAAFDEAWSWQFINAETYVTMLYKGLGGK